MTIADIPALNIEFQQLLFLVAVAGGVLLTLNALFACATSRRRGRVRGRNWLKRLLYLGFLGVVAVLAVTSFGSMLQFGHMSGYQLLAHVGAAGAFVFLLLAIAFLYLPSGIEPDDPLATGDYGWWLARFSAWALVLSSLVAAGTMFLSMLPILDTQGLIEMLAVHRYAGLAVVVAAVFHFYSLLMTRAGIR